MSVCDRPCPPKMARRWHGETGPGWGSPTSVLPKGFFARHKVPSDSMTAQSHRSPTLPAHLAWLIGASSWEDAIDYGQELTFKCSELLYHVSGAYLEGFLGSFTVFLDPRKRPPVAVASSSLLVYRRGGVPRTFCNPLAERLGVIKLEVRAS